MKLLGKTVATSIKKFGGKTWTPAPLPSTKFCAQYTHRLYLVGKAAKKAQGLKFKVWKTELYLVIWNR